MVIVCGEEGAGVVKGEAVCEDIMRRLDVEGLLDFGVGGCEEVEEDGGRDEERDERVCKPEEISACGSMAFRLIKTHQLYDASRDGKRTTFFGCLVVAARLLRKITGGGQRRQL